MHELFTASWHDELTKELAERVTCWADINSSTHNSLGLDLMAEELKRVWLPLCDTFEEILLPERLTINQKGEEHFENAGSLLIFTKRKDSAIQLLLSGHYDTVYPKECSFQKCKVLDKNILHGPGVTDMKGGLAIMHRAIKFLEEKGASDFGWQVMLNPDEEIGSIGSAPYLFEAAKKAHYGLVFEPAFSDGALVNSRKSSANITLVCSGKSAHAGRAFHEGQSAIVSLIELLVKISALNKSASHGLTVNMGTIHGGSAANIVPDNAVAEINIRADIYEKVKNAIKKINEYLDFHNQSCEAKIKMHILSERSHKAFDPASQKMFTLLQKSCKKLGMPPLSIRPSGGVCDGNILASAGLPTLDTLGAVGGAIHTYDEFLLLDSLSTRCSLIIDFIKALTEKELN